MILIRNRFFDIIYVALLSYMYVRGLRYFARAHTWLIVLYHSTPYKQFFVDISLQVFRVLQRVCWASTHQMSNAIRYTKVGYILPNLCTTLKIWKLPTNIKIVLDLSGFQSNITTLEANFCSSKEHVTFNRFRKNAGL